MIKANIGDTSHSIEVFIYATCLKYTIVTFGLSIRSSRRGTDKYIKELGSLVNSDLKRGLKCPLQQQDGNANRFRHMACAGAGLRRLRAVAVTICWFYTKPAVTPPLQLLLV